jgi:hypothetical protein
MNNSGSVLKDATRLKLLVAGIVLMVFAVASWVTLISWGWENSDRSHIVLAVRCMYSLSFTLLVVAIYYYQQERKQFASRRLRIVILKAIAMTCVFTVYGVHVVLVDFFPDGLSSIWGVLVYTMAVLILFQVWVPLQYYAGRYRSRRNEATSN